MARSVKPSLPLPPPAKPCRIAGCGKPSKALQLCNAHYLWAKNHGKEPPPVAGGGGK